MIELKTKKTPTVMEIKVPPKCSPILVAFPSEDGSLRWVDQPSSRETVLTWGLESDPLTVFRMIIDKIRERADEWDIEQSDLTRARERMSDLGIDEIDSEGNLVFPKDPSLFGSMILSGGKVFPVIHNASRALCVIKPNDS